jgi:hypothetical protein
MFSVDSGDGLRPDDEFSTTVGVVPRKRLYPLHGFTKHPMLNTSDLPTDAASFAGWVKSSTREGVIVAVRYVLVIKRRVLLAHG